MTLYEQDFYQWTQQQAGLLKAGRWREIDREHLMEEIETMERSEHTGAPLDEAMLLLTLLASSQPPNIVESATCRSRNRHVAD